MPAFERIKREQVLARFLELVAIDGPSGHERRVADHLLPVFEELDMRVVFDHADSQVGGDCGNLFAWWKGTNPDAEPIFLSCHMDTVLPTGNLRPVVDDGLVRSDGNSILGADDRAALCAYLEGLRAVHESGVRCGPVQIILTVSEQPGMLGARAMDYSLVRAKRGYIYDSSGDVGQLILQGPFSDRFRIRFRGRKAHLGLAVEEGINAIEMAANAIVNTTLGRIDAETVVGMGVIRGGEMASIIPDEVEVVGEVRSLVEDKVREQIDRVAAMAKEAAAAFGGQAEVVIEPKYQGWSIDPASEHVRAASRAAEYIGATPYFAETLGGADTNIFVEHGLTCMTLGIGFQKIHSFDEHISIDNLEAAARHVAAIIEGRTVANQ